MPPTLWPTRYSQNNWCFSSVYFLFFLNPKINVGYCYRNLKKKEKMWMWPPMWVSAHAASVAEKTELKICIWVFITQLCYVLRVFIEIITLQRVVEHPTKINWSAIIDCSSFQWISYVVKQRLKFWRFLSRGVLWVVMLAYRKWSRWLVMFFRSDYPEMSGC